MSSSTPTSSKECNKCGLRKPLTDYYKHMSNRDGRFGHCVECDRARARAYAATRRDHMREYGHSREEYNLKATYLARFKRLNPDLEPYAELITYADMEAAYGGDCFHCGGEWEEVDHYPVSIANAGAHVIENVRPSCIKCNRRKD